MTFLRPVVVALLAGSVLNAAGSLSVQSAPPAKSGVLVSVSGVVVDGSDGSIRPNADVTLAPFTQAGSVPLAQYLASRRTMRASAQGAFSFADVAAGSYSVSATAEGYGLGGYGKNTPTESLQPLTVGGDAPVSNLVVKVWKLAGISGRVLTPSNETMSEARVLLWQRMEQGGQVGYVRRPIAASSDATGRYEIPRLLQGTYVVGVISRILTYPISVQDAFHDAVTTRTTEGAHLMSQLEVTGLPTPSGRGVRVGAHVIEPATGRSPGLQSPPTADGIVLVYRSTFSPAAQRAEDAQTITLGVGEARQDVDIRMSLERGYRLSGIARGPAGPLPLVGLRLILAAGARTTLPDTTMEVAATVTDADGAFTLLGVPSGNYVLVGMTVPARTPTAPTSAGSGVTVAPSARPTGPPVVLGGLGITIDRADLSGVTLVLNGPRG